ncbi:hypothetical protein MGYG_03136 [Nannizzia gypsea CBS 118893]|uniref:Uncharacterized protein n=1 Tax=Arthroderma gypseum (strain ATCC MYA-4604 / CBS 118893) TaxID=535722 RepID=E4UR15_ARTGP|nr:hypothetical protein MGYG_03136 [Nannizzia gypsea CBS 118893]EFR00130.1 hypothetical protein MGYG_03136 [Nannizzia gypsea CBS 118893]
MHSLGLAASAYQMEFFKANEEGTLEGAKGTKRGLKMQQRSSSIIFSRPLVGRNLPTALTKRAGNQPTTDKVKRERYKPEGHDEGSKPAEQFLEISDFRPSQCSTAFGPSLVQSRG